MKTKGFEPGGLIKRDAKTFAKYLNESYGCRALPYGITSAGYNNTEYKIKNNIMNPTHKVD